jgi:hypothetical protein
LLIKNFKKGQTLKKTTTNKISAKTITLFLLKNPDKINNPTTNTTKLLGPEHEIPGREIAKLKNRIKQITSNIFNELARDHNILASVPGIGKIQRAIQNLQTGQPPSAPHPLSNHRGHNPLYRNVSDLLRAEKEIWNETQKSYYRNRQ